MGPVLGRLVSSTFDKKRITPHSLLFDQSRPRFK